MRLPFLQPLQANPFLQGQGQAQQNQQQQMMLGLMRQFAQPMAQQQLQQAQNQTAITGAQAGVAPQMQQALLQTQQAQPGLVNAQANMYNSMPNFYSAMAKKNVADSLYTSAQTDLLKGITPFAEQKAQAEVYNNPILSLLQQGSMLKQNNPAAWAMGFGNPTGVSAGNPNQGDQSSNYFTPSQNTYGNSVPGNQFSGFAGLVNRALNPNAFTQAQAAATEQGKSNVSMWQNSLKELGEGADYAQDFQQTLGEFHNNYLKSGQTGAVAGAQILQHPELANSYTQAANQAATTMQAQMIHILHFVRPTNYETQFTGGMKPNIALNAQAEKNLYGYYNTLSDLVKQKQAFMVAANQQGMTQPQADTVWNMYRNQNPIYNFKTEAPNAKSLTAWNQYLNPQAVQAIGQGKIYIPGQGIVGANDMVMVKDPQSGNTDRIPARHLNEALRRGAVPVLGQ